MSRSDIPEARSLVMIHETSQAKNFFGEKLSMPDNDIRDLMLKHGRCVQSPYTCAVHFANTLFKQHFRQ